MIKDQCCPECGKMFSKNGIGTHIWKMHGDGINHKPMTIAKANGKTIVVWNKGKTKHNDERILKGSKKVGISLKGRKNGPLSQEHRQKIADKLKKAHAEGRAWNIGKSRWNNEPSYPEKFFMKVIENEFQDKSYIREHPFDIYSIDFAWPHKMIAIEIDGQQHQRFEDYKERDVRKDQHLKEASWTVIRIPWSDFYRAPKEWIIRLKKVIDEGAIINDWEIISDLKKKRNDERLIRLQQKKDRQQQIDQQKQQLIQSQIELIRNSNIDFSKYGWVKKVSEILGIRAQYVRKWMIRNMNEFFQDASVFKR